MCVYSFNAVKCGNKRYGPWVTLRPSEPSAEMAKGINPNDNPDFTYVIWLTHMVKGMSSKTKIIVTNVISLIGPNFNIIVFFSYIKRVISGKIFCLNISSRVVLRMRTCESNWRRAASQSYSEFQAYFWYLIFSLKLR